MPQTKIRNKKIISRNTFPFLDFSQIASYEINLFRLSVCLSQSFLKIGSLVFLILYMMIADHDI